MKMNTKNLITGLLIGMILFVVFTGYANAEYKECEEEMNDVNDAITRYNDNGGSTISRIYLRYSIVAICHEKSGNHAKAVEMCGKCEEWGLNTIEWLNEVGQSKEFFGDTYGSIAECYQHIHESDKACKYCKESNEYRDGIKRIKLKCEEQFDCPKDSGIILSITGKDSGDSGTGDSGSETPSNTSGSTSGSGTGGLPITSMAIVGLILLVLLGLILFLISGRKKEQ